MENKEEISIPDMPEGTEENLLEKPEEISAFKV
jgi:hypothetical protein